jgi:four helix bundle protein
MNYSNSYFEIGFKAKRFAIGLYDLLENIPRKDYFFKDKINNLSYSLIENIYLLNYIRDNQNYYYLIQTNISLLDYLLEILYQKKYISKKQLETKILQLTEINKMINGLIKYRNKLNERPN